MIGKRCSGCKKFYNVEANFNKSKRSKDGYTSECKDCHNHRSRKKREEYKKNNIENPTVPKSKTCPPGKGCGRTFTDVEENFRRDRSTKSGFTTFCNDCDDNRSLMYRYGIDKDEVEYRIEDQEGLCFYCFELLDSNIDNLKPVVDHCHETGKVRAILHNKCNRKLGEWEAQKDRAENYRGAFSVDS